MAVGQEMAHVKASGMPNIRIRARAAYFPQESGTSLEAHGFAMMTEDNSC